MKLTFDKLTRFDTDGSAEQAIKDENGELVATIVKEYGHGQYLNTAVVGYEVTFYVEGGGNVFFDVQDYATTRQAGEAAKRHVRETLTPKG